MVADDCDEVNKVSNKAILTNLLENRNPKGYHKVFDMIESYLPGIDYDR